MEWKQQKKKKRERYRNTLVTKFLNYIAYFLPMYSISDEYWNVQSVGNWGSEFEEIYIYIWDILISISDNIDSESNNPRFIYTPRKYLLQC